MRNALKTLTGLTAIALVTLGVLAGTGTARSSAAPNNAAPPTISGSAQEGGTLTAKNGTWTGTEPISYTYRWRRCDKDGGSCSDISGATDPTYTMKSVDVGNTLRVAVTARNTSGSDTATSVPTAVVTAAAPVPAPTGCVKTVSSAAAVDVADVTAPARLVVDRTQLQPDVVHHGTQQVIMRFHVSDTCGRSVKGAYVYATSVPFNQLSIPDEQPTGADGWVELDSRTLSGFPVSARQQLLVLFVRARKPGEDLLAGISTRRLVSVRVDLSS